MSWTLKETYDFSQTRTDLCICFFIESLSNNFLSACHMTVCATLTAFISTYLTLAEKNSPWHPRAGRALWLGLAVLLLNTNNLKEHQHQMRPLCDHDGASRKQDQITFNHTWIPTKTWTLSDHKNDQTSTYLGYHERLLFPYQLITALILN